jgi:hypothetical protein
VNGRDRYQEPGNGQGRHLHLNGAGSPHRGRPFHSTEVRKGNGNRSGSGEAIEIAIPARADMLRVVRMSAGVIAARAELPYEDLDDLCLAIDELTVLVMGAHPCAGASAVDDAQGDDARLWVRFSWHAGDVTVQCVLTADGRPVPPLGYGMRSHADQAPVARTWSTSGAAEPLAHLILDALVDDYGLSEHEGRPTGWLHKRRVGASR